MADKPSKAPAAILKEARELLSDPGRWSRNALALNRAGSVVNEHSEKAVSWCALGAIHRCGGGKTEAFMLYNVEKSMYRDGIGQWNDDPSRTHAEVLAVFDAAIARAEETA